MPKQISAVDLTVTTPKGSKTFGPMPPRDASIVQAVAALTGNTASATIAR